MIFNITFTPGTVKYLRLFVFGLCKWLDCSFRLVANGCTRKELRSLEKLCRDRQALDLIVLPYPKKVSHDIALNFLQKQETSAYFCFMDSDVLATGNFLKEFIPYLGEYSAVFSGRPSWQQLSGIIFPGDHRRLNGRFIQTGDGGLLGCSYFAIYDNKKLTRLINDTGVAFNKFYWKDIPLYYQKRLERLGLCSEYYDTGKILNILMREKGEKLKYIESGGLHHLGGFSCASTRAHKPGPIGKIFGNQKRLKKKQPPLSPDTIVKRSVNRYFLDLLHAVFDNRPPPCIPQIESSEILYEVEFITERIIQDYRDYKNRL